MGWVHMIQDTCKYAYKIISVEIALQAVTAYASFLKAFHVAYNTVYIHVCIIHS